MKLKMMKMDSIQCSLLTSSQPAFSIKVLLRRLEWESKLLNQDALPFILATREAAPATGLIRHFICKHLETLQHTRGLTANQANLAALAAKLLIFSIEHHLVTGLLVLSVVKGSPRLARRASFEDTGRLARRSSFGAGSSSVSYAISKEEE